MNNIPRFPHTLITRLVTCISCQERFAVAEDDPAHGGRWRVLADQHSSTQLRYEPNLERASVTPGPRANSNVEAGRDVNQPHHDLYCPRCGTDNRTWLYVSSRERPLSLIWVWVAVFTVLAMFSVLVVLEQDLSLKRHGLLLVIWLMAGIFPLLMIPSRWLGNRNDHYLRRLGIGRRPFPPGLQTAVTIFILLVLIIPLLAFVLMPLAQTILIAIFDLVSETAAGANGSGIIDNIEFFIDWIWYVGVTNILFSTIALMAVNDFIARVDGQLPPPIFVSLAKMRRVAIWESKRTLEIRYDLKTIQWMKAERNEKGGITLNGIFRDPPDLLPNGRLDEKVRAQIYAIHTDPWCRITSATIKDYVAPRPAGGPGFVPPFPATASTEEVTVSRRRY